MDILLTAKGIIDGGDGLREYMSLLWLKVSNRVHGLVTCIILDLDLQLVPGISERLSNTIIAGVSQVCPSKSRQQQFSLAERYTFWGKAMSCKSCGRMSYDIYEIA